MKKRALIVTLILALCPAATLTQSPVESLHPSVIVKAASLLDVRKGTYLRNAAVWVEGDRIREVGSAPEIQAHAAKNAKVIDLGKATLLPGLIDCHTHIMARIPEEHRQAAFLQKMQDSIQAARTLGVKIAAGFDPSSAEEHGKNATELAAMVKLGLPSLEAIQAATVNAAELLSWQDRVGALEPGHYADLIAVDGDPLADIAVLQHVKFVMKGGTVVTAPRDN